MKLFQPIEEGFIAKCPQTLMNFVQTLAILLSKTTGICLMSNLIVENILLMVLRVLSVTLVAIDIAIPKILNRHGDFVYLRRKYCPLKATIENGRENCLNSYFLKIFSIFRYFSH